MSHTVSGQMTNYTWDVASSLPVALQDGSNTYVYGLDLISATDGAGTQTYYLYDGLGSTTDLTSGSGTTIASYSYDVFGAIRSQSGSSPNEFRFTGEQVDSTSLQYLRARYYDVATGRFLSQDPAGAGHPYAYVENNPVNLIDPYGLDACSTVSGMFGKKKDCGQVVDAVVNVVEDAAPYAATCSPLTPALCAATIYTGITGNYVDVNLSLGCLGAAFSVGVQYSAGQGFHPYGGTGSSTNFMSCSPSAAITTSLGQSITPGWNCGGQGSALFPTPWGVGLGPSGQVGKAGVKEGKHFADLRTGEWFYEAGLAVGVPGSSSLSVTCTYVTSPPLLSW